MLPLKKVFCGFQLQIYLIIFTGIPHIANLKGREFRVWSSRRIMLEKISYSSIFFAYVKHSDI